MCNDCVVSHTSSVKRLFENNHNSVAELGLARREEFLIRKLKKYQPKFSQFQQLNLVSSETNHLTVASIEISLSMTKHFKPLSDGGLIKKAILTGSNSLFHDFQNKDKIVQRTSEMPLSRNTAKDRILRVAADVSQSLLVTYKKTPFYSKCLDVGTDIISHARYVLLLCYATGDIMREELVKLLSWPGRTQGIDVHMM